MLTVGLAGGSGSGKGTVSNLFRDYGIKSINTDAVYHDLTSPGGACIAPLVAEFGKDILNSDGSLNRPALFESVFSSDDMPDRKEKLQSITHGLILQKVRDILSKMEKSGVPAVLVDAPLLFESGFDRECDLIISVIADTDIRIRRIMCRDGITQENAKKRIESQLSDDFLSKNSDFIIINNGDCESLYGKVQSIAEFILKRGK